MKIPKLTPRQTWTILLVITAIAVIFGVFVRMYKLGYPGKEVFDEVYFPKFANEYLHGVDVFDVHPPLGKFLMAIGIAIFGNIPFGWRIIPLLFGIGIIPLMSGVWWQLTKDKVGSAIIAILMAIDGIFIIYSRTGLMDGILFFFIFLSFFLMLKLKPGSVTVWVTTALGLTVSIKWVGLAILVPVLYLAIRRARWKEILFGMPWVLIIYVSIVTLGEYLNGAVNPIQSGIGWNIQAWVYQSTLTATHPYSSVWWTWPLLRKPVLFLYDIRPDGLVNVMTTRGNTLVWWLSGVMVLVSFVWLLYRRFVQKYAVADHPLTVLLIGWAACYLPFIPIHRVMFIYHYMPAYGFALLILTYWLSELWKTWWVGVILFLIIAIAVSVFFLPLAVGWMPVAQSWAITVI